MGNVIKIGEKPSFKYRRNKNPRAAVCYHVNVILDEEQRIVECANCGTVMSAFDYLVTVAHSEQSAFDKYNLLNKEVEALEKKWNRLQKQIKKANFKK